MRKKKFYNLRSKFFEGQVKIWGQANFKARPMVLEYAIIKHENTI